MSPRARRALSLLVRFAVAAGGLALAFRLAARGTEGDLVRQLLHAWQLPLAEGLAWFAGAWWLLGVGLAVGALRFRVLLRGAGLDIALSTLFRAYLVASFFNLVLPGSMLGDVYRFFDARRDTGEGARVLAIVVLERALSLAALGSLAMAVAPAILRLEDDPALFATLLAAGFVFVALPVALLLPRGNRALAALARRLGPRAPRVARSAERALAALGALAGRPAVIARAFGWSLVNQGLPVAALAMLAVPLDAWVPWYWFAVIVPFVTLVSLVPVSIGGTGVRELLYVSLFGAVGMRPEAALALSLSVLAAALVWAALGLAVFALGRRGRPAVSRPAEG